MASAAKTYVVEDADEGAKSGIPPGVFPGTLADWSTRSTPPGSGARLGRQRYLPSPRGSSGR